MRITRLYTGSDGESHFSEMELPLQDAGSKGLRSDVIEAMGIIFRETDESYELEWHPASHRQFLFTLKGKVEIEVGDGTRRQFGPGDILLTEDTTGRGHISRTVGDQSRLTAFVRLD